MSISEGRRGLHVRSIDALDHYAPSIGYPVQREAFNDADSIQANNVTSFVFETRLSANTEFRYPDRTFIQLSTFIGFYVQYASSYGCGIFAVPWLKAWYTDQTPLCIQVQRRFVIV